MRHHSTYAILILMLLQVCCVQNIPVNAFGEPEIAGPHTPKCPNTGTDMGGDSGLGTQEPTIQTPNTDS